MEPTYEQLKAIADAVEYETENNGDWYPLMDAMLKAGYRFNKVIGGESNGPKCD